MEFGISLSELKRTLDAINKVISNKTSLPIMQYALVVRTGDNTLSFTGASAEAQLTLSCEVAITGNDDFKALCIDSKRIASLLTTLNEQPLRIRLDHQKNSVRLTYDQGHFDIAAEPADGYVEPIKTTDPKVRFEIEGTELLDAMRLATVSTNSDDLRPAFSAVCLDVKDDGIVVVATNGESLWRKVFDYGTPFLKEGSEPMQMLVYGRHITAMAYFDAMDRIGFEGNESYWKMGAGNATYVCRRVEGRYPNYNSVIRENPYSITVNRVALLSVLRRVSILAPASSNSVRLVYKDGKIAISTEDIDFSNKAEETLGVEDCNMPATFNICFKGNVLARLLGTTNEERVRLTFADPSRSINVLEDTPNSTLLMLLMPLLDNL